MLENKFSWYPHPFWKWPKKDTELKRVASLVHDLDDVFPYIPQKRTVIQAGGACGIWPYYLSLHFDLVLTFEPCIENLVCLEHNCEDRNNIYPYDDVLGNGGMYQIAIDESELTNSGAYYFRPGGHYMSLRLDDIVNRDLIKNVDFICLDIEGMEADALRGAGKIIERCNPVVMIEEKPLPHLPAGTHLDARRYLESLGYEQVHAVNRDVVFKRVR